MRAIDADKLGIGKASREVFNNPAYADGWNSAIEIINNAPTLTHEDLVPHGRWETECEPHYTCSACKHWFNLYGPTNFCPNCGAKMDGGNEK